LYEELKSKTITLADYSTMVMPEQLIDSNTYSSADYSIDIHRHLDQLQKTLIEIIGQPISKQNEEF